MLLIGLQDDLIDLISSYIHPTQEKEKHLVTVQLQDLDGAAKGLKTTGTATITLLDVNDNPPTFQKASVSGHGSLPKL